MCHAHAGGAETRPATKANAARRRGWLMLEDSSRSARRDVPDGGKPLQESCAFSAPHFCDLARRPIPRRCTSGTRGGARARNTWACSIRATTRCQWSVAGERPSACPITRRSDARVSWMRVASLALARPVYLYSTSGVSSDDLSLAFREAELSRRLQSLRAGVPARDSVT